MTETQPILFITVGGSYKPVLTAIQATAPRYVCFFCTGKDEATAQPGSRAQVEGRGNVIKETHDADKPTLPNIPTQAGLGKEQFEICEIPADDMDRCVETMHQAIQTLIQRFPDSPLVADYTGGTKTMTAALVVAALDNEAMQLKLVTGARGNLRSVQDGTEESASATVEAIRLQRAMAPHMAAWNQYFYGAAARGLAALHPPGNKKLASQRRIALDLSHGFDAWDRFDHQQAWTLINTYKPRVGPKLQSGVLFLSILAATAPDPRQEPARLWDLWLNAQRRAVQGRYDDAVARLYRLLEWTAQWLLRTRANLDTSDLDGERVPEGIKLTQNQDGRLQAGLYSAWDIAGHLIEGPAAEFAASQHNTMRNHLSARNESILAHGFQPIGESEWQQFSGWMESEYLPLLRAESARAGLSMTPAQLPRKAFW